MSDDARGLSPASQGPCSWNTVVDGPLPMMQAPLVAEDGYQEVVDNINCIQLMSSELVEPMEPCALVPARHQKMASIGKVADEFNLATSGSDDAWTVGKGCTLATGRDANFYDFTELIQGLLVVPSITHGLNHLVNERKVNNVNQVMNAALGIATSPRRC